MKHFLRAAAANPEIKVADPEYNGKQITKVIAEAARQGVELLAFPELCLTGSTCGDLFMQSALICETEKALDKIVKSTENSLTAVFLGTPAMLSGRVRSCCAVIQSGKLLCVIPKTERGEACAQELKVLRCGSVTAGVEIGGERTAPQTGSLVTVCLSASSARIGGAEQTVNLIASKSIMSTGAYIYANAGRGESSTDAAYCGNSVIAENGEILAENKPFENNLFTVADIDIGYLRYERARLNAAEPSNAEYIRFELSESFSGELRRNVGKLPFVSGAADAQLALKIQTYGLVKRMGACGAKKLVLGLSGGLDSALALIVCERALKQLNLPPHNLIAISMPGFGTGEQTAQSARELAQSVKADYRVIDIRACAEQHFKDINHDINVRNVTYENAQARIRTLILMDIANSEGGIAVGTGDLSEEALGWCTYNGDHMAMYNVNASVPKTLVKYIVKCVADECGGDMGKTLTAVLCTDISPELLPPENGKITQKTEDIIGKFELNDLFLYYAVKRASAPEAALIYAASAFGGKPSDYAEPLKNFYKRFFSSQFKRSCSPDGAAVGFSLSPRGDWNMPSDAEVNAWLKQTDKK